MLVFIKYVFIFQLDFIEEEYFFLEVRLPA